MSNPFTLIQQSIDSSYDLVSKYIGEEKVQELKQEIKAKINNQKLQVMLYGAYNAGKSTLVNVLLGAEKAPINDIPTTFKVDRYEWEGVHLLDTPGVNAPIEHEEATEEQVKRSSLMLFVIREGDQDSKDLYQRLFKMLKMGKKVFIVLNHQVADDKDKAIALVRITKILTKMAADQGIDDQKISAISVFPINFKTAFLARKKNSEKLLEHSGYSLFIESFRQWYSQYDNDNGYLSSIQKMTDEIWFSPAIDILKKQLDEADASNINALQSNRSILENEKRLLINSSKNYIRQEVNMLKSDISQALKSCTEQAQLDTQLQGIFTPLISKVETWLEGEMEKIRGKLVLPIDTADVLHSHDSQKEGGIPDVAIDGVKKVVGDESNIKDALLFARKLKIPGIKGRWASTLGKWAGKAAVVVQVVSFFYDIYKAGQDQDKQNNATRQQSIELYQAVDQICSSVIGDLSKAVTDIVTLTFDEKITVLQVEIDKLTAESSVLRKDHEEFLRRRDAINSLSF